MLTPPTPMTDCEKEEQASAYMKCERGREVIEKSERRNSTRHMKIVPKFVAKPMVMVATLVMSTAHESRPFGESDLGIMIFAPIENNR